MRLQEWIYKLEEGPWYRYIKTGAVCLAVALLVIGYNWFSFRNMSSLDAMDAAQVARNVSEGKGFTTLFIRPVSIYLVKKHNQAHPQPVKEGENPDYARIKEARHPDLANAPVYPAVLAGWMKVYPLLLSTAEGIRSVLPEGIKGKLPPFNDSLGSHLWTNNGRFWWHPHDFMIAMFNEVLFFIVIWLTFLLARRLFDAGVAWLSAALLLGCEYLWHFSTSGLSTMLLLLIFTGLVWCLVLFEEETREPRGGANRLLLLALAAGLLTGTGGLTRYSFGWMLIPVLVFVGLLGGQRRLVAIASAVAAFLVVVSPWIYRNVSVSGTPFGTAGYALMETTPGFAENQLERSLQPDVRANFTITILRKFSANSRQVLMNDLPKMGGGWVTPFFLVGLMLGFRNPGTRRLRYFVVMSLPVLILVQTLGRTQLSADSPDFNSENLLVLLLPVIVVYGVSLFFVLLDQMALPFPQLRNGAIGVFTALVCMPLIYSFLPPRSRPVAYPPYYPPLIQENAAWMKENELMMSDIPWAVAWYGNRQCVWLTLNLQDDFYAVNDYLKPVRALYLSPNMMDSHFVSQWVSGGEKGWGYFIIDVILRQQIPSQFPLRKMQKGFLPDHLFLADRERWKTEPGIAEDSGK